MLTSISCQLNRSENSLSRDKLIHLIPNFLTEHTVFLHYHIFYFYFCGFFFNLFFNWRETALQYCDGFCHSAMQISHKYTCITSFLSLPPLSHPLDHRREPGWAPNVIQQLLTSYLFYTL